MKKILNLAAISLFFAATLLLLSSFWATKLFYVDNVDQILFYMTAPLEGVDLVVIMSYSVLIAASFLGSAGYAMVIFDFRKKTTRKLLSLLTFLSILYISGAMFCIAARYDIFYYLNYTRSLSLFIGILTAIVFVGCLAYVAAVFFRKNFIHRLANLLTFLSIPYLLGVMIYIALRYDVYSYLTATRTMSPFIEKEYAAVVPEELQVMQKNNLILILLESVEETFNNTNVFEKLIMPELENMRQAHTSFYGYNEVPGTTWTAAGICSYLLGLPVKLPINGHEYDSLVFSSFLPGAASIIRLLEAHDYKLDIFLGANIAFGGIDNLFKDHSSTATIHDLLFYQTARGDAASNMGSGWGLRDSYLYERVKEFLTERPKHSNGNFFVLIETVDTHMPQFVADDYQREYNDARDAFRAAGIMVADFVAWAQLQPFYENTTIIILGDHFHMAEDLGGIKLPPEQRDIYNVFINSVPTINGKFNRSYSPMDIAPTILESIGFVLPANRFALGTSLFAPQKTLIEQMGIETFSKELAANSQFYQALFYKTSVTTED